MSEDCSSLFVPPLTRVVSRGVAECIRDSGVVSGGEDSATVASCCIVIESLSLRRISCGDVDAGNGGGGSDLLGVDFIAWIVACVNISLKYF